MVLRLIASSSVRRRSRCSDAQRITHLLRESPVALASQTLEGDKMAGRDVSRTDDTSENHTETTPALHFATIYGMDDHAAMRHSVTLRAVEDYTNKYKGEQVEVALFGGEYQEGVLTAYCSFEEVPHVELNGHILIPLQNVASLHCSSRCDAPEPDWPPRGFIEDDTGDS